MKQDRSEIVTGRRSHAPCPAVDTHAITGRYAIPLLIGTPGGLVVVEAAPSSPSADAPDRAADP
ncbi:hypothetical protein [Streptomyces sp. B1I3]|uniref:hypothetical protein n=1 Tax=Streptomyces sp. B1I3 TaxID=3042264 RepID=UPI002785BFEF|nr:hypothetical protein [Streptomyces sp. B1I3]MDQ0793598.1 hypothetical protein [Streptomyces sp. B1I3]